MDNRNYYENFDWESASLNEKLTGKIEMLFNIIPDDVKTIIDIGCGDGTISNALAKKYDVLAVDRSENALKHVNTKKLCASADSVPVDDKSFDLVFSSEMIEHLPDEVFNKALKEFDRISSKYILLTFPNNENVDKQKVQCPYCEYIFNKSYHLRCINKRVIKKVFNKYSIDSSFKSGIKVRYYNRVLSFLKHKLTPPDSWIPPLWTKNMHRNTMCPECEKKFEIPFRNNIFARFLDYVNIIISRKRQYQLGILLRKKDAE